MICRCNSIVKALIILTMLCLINYSMIFFFDMQLKFLGFSAYVSIASIVFIVVLITLHSIKKDYLFKLGQIFSQKVMLILLIIYVIMIVVVIVHTMYNINKIENNNYSEKNINVKKITFDYKNILTLNTKVIVQLKNNHSSQDIDNYLRVLKNIDIPVELYFQDFMNTTLDVMIARYPDLNFRKTSNVFFLLFLYLYFSILYFLVNLYFQNNTDQYKKQVLFVPLVFLYLLTYSYSGMFQSGWMALEARQSSSVLETLINEQNKAKDDYPSFRTKKYIFVK